MGSYELFIERFPPHLLAAMRRGVGGAAWPLAAIPAVIEASRVAGLVSLGGDLQIHGEHGVWESANVGVAVFQHELSAPDRLVDDAAAIALKKFVALGGERELLMEVAAGWPGASEAIAHGTPPQLYFSWAVQSA